MRIGHLAKEAVSCGETNAGFRQGGAANPKLAPGGAVTIGKYDHASVAESPFCDAEQPNRREAEDQTRSAPHSMRACPRPHSGAMALCAPAVRIRLAGVSSRTLTARKGLTFTPR